MFRNKSTNSLKDSTVSSKESSKDENVHLFVLVHGLLGNPNHMNTIEKTVLKTLKGVGSQRIVTIKPSSFRFWKTYDGIQRCAELVIADIFYEIEALKQTNKYTVSLFSIVGYSLGGLISRYVIGCLHEMGFFNEVTPVFYSSFATPHIGVRFFKKQVFDIVSNSCAPFLFGKTGNQLFLTDSQKLLIEMANPSSRYYKGLEQFECRILMANIKNDRSVAFYTSYITNYSPFDQLDYVDLKYFENLPPVTIGKVTVWPKFVDLARCIKLTAVKEYPGNAQEDTSLIRRNKVLKYTILLMAATILIPFYIPLVLLLSFCVSTYSKIKIRFLKALQLEKHWHDVKESVYRGGEIHSENAQQGEDRRMERLKLSKQESIKGDTSKLAEHAFGNVMYAEQNFIDDHTHLYDEDRPIDDSDPDQLVDSEGGFSDEDEAVTPKESLIGSLLGKKPKLEIPFHDNDIFATKYLDALQNSPASNISLFSSESKLPDNEERELMVKNLNSLPWVKIPVYFDLFNAHATIVARTVGFKNPKATSTIFLWGSVLRNHLSKDFQNNEESSMH